MLLLILSNHSNSPTLYETGKCENIVFNHLCVGVNSLYPGLIATVPVSAKKRMDVKLRLTNAIFKDTLKDKDSKEYVRLRNHVEKAVSYFSGYDYFLNMFAAQSY